MVTALLLQVGLLGFQREVAAASRNLGVPPPQVLVAPVDLAHARRMAWGPICRIRHQCPPATIHIATDVAALAPARVLRYLAYHEVCHVKLGHLDWEGGWLDPTVTHSQVDACLFDALGTRARTLKWEHDLFGESQIRPLRARRFGDAAYR